jgi:hypothetical protein
VSLTASLCATCRSTPHPTATLVLNGKVRSAKSVTVSCSFAMRTALARTTTASQLAEDSLSLVMTVLMLRTACWAFQEVCPPFLLWKSCRYLPSKLGDPTIQWQPLVMLSKGYTVKFTHPTPPQLTFQLTNWNARDWARLGKSFRLLSISISDTCHQVSATLLLRRLPSRKRLDTALSFL